MVFCRLSHIHMGLVLPDDLTRSELPPRVFRTPRSQGITDSLFHVKALRSIGMSGRLFFSSQINKNGFGLFYPLSACFKSINMYLQII